VSTEQASFSLFVARGFTRLWRSGRSVQTISAALAQRSVRRWIEAGALAIAFAATGFLDRSLSDAARATSPAVHAFFATITDLGLGGVVLVPVGVLALVLMGVGFWLLRQGQRRLASLIQAFTLRLAFVFVAVGGAGLAVFFVKRIIGRARPFVSDEMNTLIFKLVSFSGPYASFPSGHATTSFAAAIAFSCLSPRWRPFWLSLAVLIAVSRVVIGDHFPSDVIGGAMFGGLFAMGARNWFARRGLVFSPLTGSLLAKPGQHLWARFRTRQPSA